MKIRLKEIVKLNRLKFSLSVCFGEDKAKRGSYTK